MSFSIDIQSLSDFKRIRIANQSINAHIDIISKGGLLNSWVNSTLDIIDGNDFGQGWENFEAHGFKSGKMNPYSCRLYNGKYEHDQKHYHIEKFYLGDHALHGVLYDALFEIESTHIQSDSAYVILKYDYHKEDPGFPFEYQVQIKWIFSEDNKVTVQTIIHNKDHVSFPMMDGWHPYFSIGNSIDDCTLQFTNKGMLAYNAALIPTGEILKNNQFEKGLALAGVELDNGFIVDDENPNCILENTKYKLVIHPDHHYPYLQLYTPPGRKSIAIENLSGAPDCFNNKMGLHIMQPHSTWKLETQFQLFSK